MPTIEDFKQIRSSVSPEIETELYGLLIQDLDAAVESMIGIVVRMVSALLLMKSRVIYGS